MLTALIFFSGIVFNITDGLSQDLGPLEHAGENCWNPCNTRQGKCNWCGTDGWCCSLGSIGNGCDGSFGGDRGHVCVIKPGKLIFLPAFITYVLFILICTHKSGPPREARQPRPGPWLD